jgi:glycerol-3-phosphate dehydrogenase
VVTVLGAGSFGTAMAVVAARKGHTVRLLARDPAQVAAINAEHRNPKRLSDFTLSPNITATTDPAEALRGTSLVIHAIPVQKSPEFLGPSRAPTHAHVHTHAVPCVHGLTGRGVHPSVHQGHAAGGRAAGLDVQRHPRGHRAADV